jgi:hypothetical protein
MRNNASPRSQPPFPNGLRLEGITPETGRRAFCLTVPREITLPGAKRHGKTLPNQRTRVPYPRSRSRSAVDGSVATCLPSKSTVGTDW